MRSCELSEMSEWLSAHNTTKNEQPIQGDKNSTEQCFAADIVYVYHQYCSELLHLIQAQQCYSVYECCWGERERE